MGDLTIFILLKTLYRRQIIYVLVSDDFKFI